VTTPDTYSKPYGENLEALLADAYAVEIPPHLRARLDERVSAALRQLDAWNRPGPQPATRHPHRLAVITGLLIVALTTVAAGVGVYYVTCPPEVFYPSDGGFTWERGEPLGLSQVVDGYSITLERAYADANKAMVAVSVEDVEDRGWAGISLDGITLTDSRGVGWEATTGVAAPGSASTQANISWYVAVTAPAPPGRRAFHVAVQRVNVLDRGAGGGQSWHTIPVDASFDFDLTVVPGWEATPQVSAEHDGVTVHLDRVVAAPSTVRLELRFDGLAKDRDWSPVLSVRHDGRSVDAEMASAQIGSTSWTVYTSGGFDSAEGDWTVRVSEIVGEPISDYPQAPDPEAPPQPEATQVRLQGPWTLNFSTP
jgi:hypothetical protein